MGACLAGIATKLGLLSPSPPQFLLAVSELRESPCSHGQLQLASSCSSPPMYVRAVVHRAARGVGTIPSTTGAVRLGRRRHLGEHRCFAYRAKWVRPRLRE